MCLAYQNRVSCKVVYVRACDGSVDGVILCVPVDIASVWENVSEFIEKQMVCRKVSTCGSSK